MEIFGKSRRTTAPGLALAAAVLWALAGCGWFEDPSPNEARLVVDGDAGVQVRIVVSKVFVAGVDQTQTTRVELIRSDTLFRTLPFEGTYDIRDEQRFFAEASVMEEELDALHMRVFLDGDPEFNETGPLFVDAPFRFVFTFNQRVTSNIEVF